MLSIQVDSLSLNLLEDSPNYLKLTTPQAETYRLLWAIASVPGMIKIREAVLCELLKIQNPQALHCRLKNLIAKGWMAIA